MDILLQIKRLVVRGRLEWTASALTQMLLDNLTEEDVVESLLNAQRVRAKRSTSRHRKHKTEKVYIIESFSYSGILVYTKGTFRRRDDQDVFYILISAKRSLSQ